MNFLDDYFKYRPEVFNYFNNLGGIPPYWTIFWKKFNIIKKTGAGFTASCPGEE
jgi:hypothetical protein